VLDSQLSIVDTGGKIDILKFRILPNIGESHPNIGESHRTTLTVISSSISSMLSNSTIKLSNTMQTP
jgi:hypothetical protein